MRRIALMLWSESECYFRNILSQNGFESDCPKTKFQTITSQSQFEKVTVKKSIWNSGQLFPIKWFSFPARSGNMKSNNM